MNNEIRTYKLDNQYLFIHKEGIVDSRFGMDHTPELIGNGFGIYSSNKVKSKIGPLKSQFFRIGFCRQGSLDVDFGLETFTHVRDTIHFNFPGQLFSMKNVSSDMLSYYILFSADFIEELLPCHVLQAQYPFLDYSGIPFFKLSQEEANTIERLFFEIDKEVQADKQDKVRAIIHIVFLILIEAKRSYTTQGLSTLHNNSKASSLVHRYKKMVNQHFLKIRNVAEYASRLTVSPKHLNKVIKEETGKTPGAFIDEMLMMEIKALLRHSELSISEIAYQLDFTDPPHFNNFFKRNKGVTPLQYRNETK